jgi:hypothetical protein
MSIGIRTGNKFRRWITVFIHFIIQDFVELVYLFSSTKGPNAVSAKALKKDGIVVVENFLDESECASIKTKIDTVLSNDKAHPENTAATIFYRDIDNNAGYDTGMIDIENLDKEIPDIWSPINRKRIESIIASATSRNLYLRSINAYINQSVTNTRSAHSDNVQPPIYKAFITLTDVESYADGPYTFVKKSHRLSLTRYINMLINLFIPSRVLTDFPYYLPHRKVAGLAKKGTLIISNQSGIHRGHPQEKGHKRCMLVMSYLVVSKLNRVHKTAKDLIKNAKDNLET